MAPDPHCCPADPEELAEGYAMDALDATDLAAFEEHLLICDTCRAAVEAADQYVCAMTGAAREWRSAGAKRETLLRDYP